MLARWRCRRLEARSPFRAPVLAVDASAAKVVAVPTLSLPLAAEWEEKRVAWLRTMHDGLRGAGADARLDPIGTKERPVQLLRVSTPARWLEEADVWLMRLVEPLSETAEWASHIELLLTAFRWPEFAVWSGGERDCAAIAGRIPPRSREARWPGSRFLQIGTRQPTIAAFPRTASAVLRHLPGVSRADDASDGAAPNQSEVAIDVALKDELALHHELQRTLDGVGVPTRRWSLADDGSLLALDIGDDWLDQFEERLVHTLAAAKAPWPARLRLWTWSGAILVHRHPDEEGWRVREWLEERIGAPCVSASREPQSEEVTIRVPAAIVDRALAILRERFG